MKILKMTLALFICAALMLAPPLSGAGAAVAASREARARSAGPTARLSARVYAQDGMNDALAAEIVRQVNAERAKKGLSQLSQSAELTRAARVRALEVAVKFSHTRPDGSAWHTVSAFAYGENLAMGQRTADKAMAAWLTSSGHRANILRASYGSIGVCC